MAKDMDEKFKEYKLKQVNSKKPLTKRDHELIEKYGDLSLVKEKKEGFISKLIKPKEKDLDKIIQKAKEQPKLKESREKKKIDKKIKKVKQELEKKVKEPVTPPKEEPAKEIKKKTKAPVKEKDIRKLFKKKTDEKKKKMSAAARKRKLGTYIEKAGLSFSGSKASRIIFLSSIIGSALLSIVYAFWLLTKNEGVLSVFGRVFTIMIILFIVIWGALWLILRIYLDLMMFRRKLQVEEVLPDFLQLTSANLRAGMPIDRALWFAVRPRFGVLSREIEDVAKRTLAGDDLQSALLNFAKKYDSNTLLRSIYLLNEGMAAGGDVADLLNKIALNIQEMRGMKKEMAANVTTYVIFITFAAIIAAPFLFGLSNQLLVIVQGIAADVAASGSTQSSSMGLTINIKEESIRLVDYRIFAYVSLFVSATFSAIIVSTIKKGNVKEGMQYIPIFIIVALIMFYIATKGLSLMFQGVF